jgi:hypothetical protein
MTLYVMFGGIFIYISRAAQVEPAKIWVMATYQ